MSQRLIRVYAMTPWPGDHGAEVRAHPASEKYPKPTVPFKMMFSIGKPVAPELGWNCGTDVVWPVYQINGEDIEPTERGQFPYVCRHQIVIGD